MKHRFGISIAGLGLLAVLLSPGSVMGKQPYVGPNGISQEKAHIARFADHKRSIPVIQRATQRDQEDTLQAAAEEGNQNGAPVVRRNTLGCSGALGNNVRINSDCGFRPQNETAIAVNPTDPNNLIAGTNDYRLGDGLCPYYYSFDGARSWGDGTLPVSPVITNDPTYVGDDVTSQKRKYFQVGGDPAVTFDSTGVAYSICGLFDRTTPDNALFVARSFTGGSYYQRNGQDTRQRPRGVGGINGNGPVPVQEHYNDPTLFSDKQYITADQNPSSPFANNVYVTWTEFLSTAAGDYVSSNIFFSRSTNQGYSFEKGRPISGANSKFCVAADPAGNGASGCDANQFSDPFVGPDGALYVVFANYNNPIPASTPNDNRNQILIVKSSDGGVTFTPPQKVADYYDLPECAPGDGSAGAANNLGRSCVGTNNVNGGTDSSHFRAANYPSGAVDPTNPSALYVHFGSYVNKLSNETASGCFATGFAATGNNTFTGHCRNHILQARSTDGGLHFDGTTTDPRALPIVSGGADAHQWWQWTAAAPNGRIDVSFYDRSYAGCQQTGCQDITLASLAGRDRDENGDGRGYARNRVTSSSMPPPTQFGGGFLGDYSGLASTNEAAYPLWSDTRRADTQAFEVGRPGSPSGVPLNDQDGTAARVTPPSRGD
jgi:hypothetical protein